MYPSGLYGGYSSYPGGSYSQYQNMPQNQQYMTPYQQMAMQQQNQQMQVIKGRPVSSYDEAKASMIDLDGSLFVFTDVANKRIYTKQVMLDGTSDFKVYQLVENSNKTNAGNVGEQNGEYVLKKDFDKVVSTLLTRINKLKEELGYDESGNESNVNA